MKIGITETTIFELYVDLWGYSIPWIDAISEALHKFCQPSLGDECETCTCPACMAVRFNSTDRARIEEAKRIVSRLFNLAGKRAGHIH